MEKNNKETRSTTHEFRAVLGDDGKKKIVGYAAIFNSETDIMGFREKVAPGAFDDVLQQDVRALFNHDPNMVLARTKSGTLKLEVDATGLKYEFYTPDTTAGKDLAESVARGDIDQSSFGFTVKSDTWTKNDEGRDVRTINKVGQLFDISPVTYPAYEDTAVALRSQQRWKKGLHKNDAIKREIEQFKLNNTI